MFVIAMLSKLPLKFTLTNAISSELLIKLQQKLRITAAMLRIFITHFLSFKKKHLHSKNDTNFNHFMAHYEVIHLFIY